MAMLKVLEGLCSVKDITKLKEEANPELVKKKPGENRRKVALTTSEKAHQDGLNVDYNKFTNLTFEMMKKTGVVRNKSIKSPVKDFVKGSAFANSQLGGSISIPPMSARLSSPGTSGNFIRHQNY